MYTKISRVLMSFAGSAVALGAALGMTIGAGSARAGQPHLIPAWYDDQIEHVIPGVSANVVGVQNS